MLGMRNNAKSSSKNLSLFWSWYCFQGFIFNLF